MPDNITWSVKMNEETQERLRGLVEESGFNNKDFFINLLSVYEIQRAKEITPILTADIEELETLTRRINSIFANASERINTLQREANVEKEKQAESNQSTIALLQQRINGLEQDRIHDEERLQSFIEDKEQAENKSSELSQQIKQLEQAITDKQLLIDEYKEKLDAQTSIVAEYRQLAEEAKAIKKENDELTAKIQGNKRELNDLNEKINKQSEQHTADLERLKDTLNIEREKALLELRAEHQRELQTQQELYNDKVKDLLERLENQTAAPKTSPPSNRSKKSTSKKTTTDTKPNEPATNEQ